MPIVNQTSYGVTNVNIYDAGVTQKHALGTRAFVSYGVAGDKSAELVYIKALTGLTAGNLCELPLIGGTDAYQVDTALTTTNANTIANAIGSSFAGCVPAINMLAGEFGWAFVRGIFPLFVGASCVFGAKLFTTATAGLVDDTATANELIGAFLIATVGGANIVADCFAPADLRIIKNS